MVLLFGQVVPIKSVSKSRTKDVLEIDVAQAWDDSDQKASWSNEVVVEVLVR